MKAEFLQKRFWGLFDNLLAGVVLSVVALALPVVIGLILKLKFDTILLALLLIWQFFIFLSLLSIRRKLSSKSKRADQLVREADSNTIYLIDRFGLPHPINDEDTALYFMQMLGYEPDELPEVSPRKLKPTGAEVAGRREWSSPATIEDKMSAEARRTLKVLRKDIRTEDGSKILTFYVRNDSEHNLQIIQPNWSLKWMRLWLKLIYLLQTNQLIVGC